MQKKEKKVVPESFGATLSGDRPNVRTGGRTEEE